LELAPDDRFIDPSCGSGTFLIERYQQVVGEEADQGLATYDEVVSALERLAGNDLNTFSAVLAQIQILWHVLGFRDDLLKAEEFPDIAISDKANSIIRPGVEIAQHGRFIEIDRPDYGGVGGNPPYVRPERAGEIDDRTREYFENGYDRWPGISAEANLYALFMYRALDGWCRQPNRWGENAGRLGFVVPLALCGTNENSDLRRLFGPNGRWTIKEIVDLEVIWRNVFDADVLPIVIIVEARPPRLPLDAKWLNKLEPLPERRELRHQVRAARLQPWLDNRLKNSSPKHRDVWERIADRNRRRWVPDQVLIKLADKSCIDFGDGTKRPSFDLAAIKPALIEYSDLFTPDGRIVTRITPERRAIVNKLRANSQLSSALRQYWNKKSGQERGSVRLTAPSIDSFRWELREMISRGVVFAGRKKHAQNGVGHKIYKGENIVSGEIFGEPQDTGVDISAARNRYLFEFMGILPERLWAVPMITTCPNAVSFDPREVAFTDTATIFAPRTELAKVPFDMLFVSRVYRYFYALTCRMSFLNMNRSHVYPTNLRLLPWNDAVASIADDLEALRAPLVSACENHFRTETAMFAALEKLPLRPFRVVVREGVKATGGKVEWSESLLKGTEKIELSAASKAAPEADGWHVSISEYLLDWIKVPDESAALGLAMALRARAGTEQKMVDRATLLDMPIPPDAEMRESFARIISDYRDADHADAIEAVVDKIDGLIGPALGLDKDDLALIRKEMIKDPFLRNIVPRWPATQTRLHGYRTGLDSSDRYS